MEGHTLTCRGDIGEGAGMADRGGAGRRLGDVVVVLEVQMLVRLLQVFVSIIYCVCSWTDSHHQSPETAHMSKVA